MIVIKFLLVVYGIVVVGVGATAVVLAATDRIQFAAGRRAMFAQLDQMLSAAAAEALTGGER